MAALDNADEGKQQARFQGNAVLPLLERLLHRVAGGIDIAIGKCGARVSIESGRVG